MTIEMSDTPALKARLAEVEPQQWFSEWAYAIGQQHWGTLGVEHREYVDKEPTKELRTAARKEGMAPKDVLRLRVMRKAWVNTTTPDFQEFDLFWSADGDHALQIVNIDDMVEVHRIATGLPRKAYRMTEATLVNCLKTGLIPENTRITNAASARDVLRYSIENP